MHAPGAIGPAEQGREPLRVRANVMRIMVIDASVIVIG
jgi:hypothetical protein